MKVRVGFGLGTRTASGDAERFAGLVDALEALRFDSLWLSEKITDDCPDPLIALAFAASRTSRLKLGTSVLVLPGRNPMLLAKELATLDRLSGGRLLPAFGLGQVDPGEQQADPTLQAAEDERPPREGDRLALFGDERSAASFHRASRHLSRPRTIRATTG